MISKLKNYNKTKLTLRSIFIIKHNNNTKNKNKI